MFFWPFSYFYDFYTKHPFLMVSIKTILCFLVFPVDNVDNSVYKW